MLPPQGGVKGGSYSNQSWDKLYISPYQGRSPSWGSTSLDPKGIKLAEENANKKSVRGCWGDHCGKRRLI